MCIRVQLQTKTFSGTSAGYLCYSMVVLCSTPLIPWNAQLNNCAVWDFSLVHLFKVLFYSFVGGFFIHKAVFIECQHPRSSPSICPNIATLNITFNFFTNVWAFLQDCVCSLRYLPRKKTSLCYWFCLVSLALLRIAALFFLTNSSWSAQYIRSTTVWIWVVRFQLTNNLSSQNSGCMVLLIQFLLNSNVGKICLLSRMNGLCIESQLLHISRVSVSVEISLCSWSSSCSIISNQLYLDCFSSILKSLAPCPCER